MKNSGSRLLITDTTLRDAHQSLIATRMRTEDMLSLTRSIDKAGFFSVEAWGGATFDSCIRFLNEDPWERLTLLKEELKKTPIQMLLRGQNLVGYRHYSDDVVDKFVDLSYKNGVDIFRVFDALNDVRNMDRSMKRVKETGAHLQATISYTISPVHSVKGFVEMARDLYSYDCDSICIKDMAGLISPGDARDLICGIKDEMDVLVDLHCHCTSGLAPMSYQAAIEAGVDILDTAMSPFAMGTSQPPTESCVASVSGTSRDTGIDMLALREIRNECNKLRSKYGGLFMPVAERIDSDVLIYQLPGGMITNLVSQLQQQDALDRLLEVIEEIPKVRKDLGYPPLVTPTSQIVGTQAVLNVLLGERYKTITGEVTEYVKGQYGRSPAAISDEIRKKIIGDEPVITCRPADLIESTYEKMEAEARAAGLIKKDEDILTYILFPAIAPSFLKGERAAEKIPVKSLIPESESGKASLLIPEVMQVEVDGEAFTVRILSTGEIGSVESRVHAPPAEVEGGIKSHMQGMVLEFKVATGDKVKEGDTLLILEAMKMENPISSPIDGTVGELFVQAGDTVQNGDVLLVVQ